MPIRINLLAETQAAEDMRRRDPVKRVAIIGACLVGMIAIWLASLYVEVMVCNGHLHELQQSMNSHTNDYATVMESQHIIAKTDENLVSLNRLATERFLVAPLLDAVARANVSGIQLTHFNTDQSIETTQEIPPVKDKGKTTPGKPATSIEKSKLVLNGRDCSANPGDEQINKFKSALADTEYFRNQHITTNNILLKSLSAPQAEAESGRLFVQFVLECSYPDKTR